MEFLVSSFLSLPSDIGINYLEAFPKAQHGTAKAAPTILLLHGFPTASSQFSRLIPLITDQGYHVLAPDLPGFGFTSVSPNYTYTFANLAVTISSFLAAKNISEVAATYIFDYGAPVAFRLFTKHNLKTKAIISQNGAFWDPFREFWTSNNSASIREELRSALLTYDPTKWQYTNGETPDRVNKINAAATYERDYNLLLRPGNQDIQLDLFYDYRTNVKLYPEWQAWLGRQKLPLLAIWGKNDEIFISPGAEAFKQDLPDAVVKFVDGGHFASITWAEEIAAEIGKFLKDAEV
ncbi:hypothetical protein EPUS_01531 [Endocarpon pusillum Z07020]|uniref:AB hydrolase-1 domain-containing protein n=1 Tax=Endocarpon pusillum (strain Z07020 / HMAS-L-300199) TaxID=1263415 RepID=U1GUJ6_ENDPU|nr:uncharacterized protein EPUS_01531 [Endocarpon pusillum Z07020]ERF75701.1 hypothetical protein EPUS_01531 [Endocarpon pusillum Z07020]